MSNELTILLYHGVTDTPSRGIENFSRKHISDTDFREQMRYISKHCSVLSMDEVADIAQSGKHLPPKATAVTFDDGFRNNYTVAAPILEECRVPATFYITSGIINTDIMFWVDELEDCMNLSTHPSIEITLDKKDLIRPFDRPKENRRAHRD